MIVEKQISMSMELLEDVRYMAGVDEYDICFQQYVLEALHGYKLINFDDLKRRISPNSFEPLATFKLTYDDSVKCSDADNIETLELEMVANNI